MIASCYGGCDCQRCSGEPTEPKKSDKQICSDDWDELIAKRKKTLTVYKIRNKAGLYSTGGCSPKWTKRGKTWVAVNHVNAHLSLIRSEQKRWNDLMTGKLWTESQKRHMRENSDRSLNPYDGCEVVALHMQEKGAQQIVDGRVNLTSIKDFVVCCDDKGLNL